jgi:hypothetical protein
MLEALLSQGRYDEIIDLTQAMVSSSEPKELDLYYYFMALKGKKNLEAALLCASRMCTLYPKSKTAWYNYAAILGDINLAKQALDAIEKAEFFGVSREYTGLIRARCHVQLCQFDLAKDDFQTLLKSNKAPADAIFEYAQLIWMQTGDLQAAIAPFENQDIESNDDLILKKVQFLTYANALQRAYETVKSAFIRNSQSIEIGVSYVHSALLVHEVKDALQVSNSLYGRSQILGTTSNYQKKMIIDALFMALCANGQNGSLKDIAEMRLLLDENDQAGLAYFATASRLNGSEDFNKLYDYDRFVKTYQLTPPKEWDSIGHYLNDLSSYLISLHTLKAHPFNQSLRGGTQTTCNLIRSENNTLKALFKGIQECLDKYTVDIGDSNHPFVKRKSYGYDINASWSVLLNKNGFHVDHIHPEGWISAAFYVATPKDIHDTQGYLRLGQPPFKTIPNLPAQKWIKPEPGTLVFFPSYMWHGTETFFSKELRLAVACDIIPKSI